MLLLAYGKAFGMPVDTLVAMGTAVNPAINSLLTFVVLAVAPFNILKGLIVGVITFLLYKHVSPILHGTQFLIQKSEYHITRNEYHVTGGKLCFLKLRGILFVSRETNKHETDAVSDMDFSPGILKVRVLSRERRQKMSKIQKINKQTENRFPESV